MKNEKQKDIQCHPRPSRPGWYSSVVRGNIRVIRRLDLNVSRIASHPTVPKGHFLVSGKMLLTTAFGSVKEWICGATHIQSDHDNRHAINGNMPPRFQPSDGGSDRMTPRMSTISCKCCREHNAQCDRLIPNCSYCLHEQLLCFYIEPEHSSKYWGHWTYIADGCRTLCWTVGIVCQRFFTSELIVQRNLWILMHLSQL